MLCCGHGFRGASRLWVGSHGGCGVALALGVVGDALWQPGRGSAGRRPLCWVGCRPDGEGCMGLIFYLAYFFPVKPQVCNAGDNCSNPNFILFHVKSCLFSL